MDLVQQAHALAQAGDLEAAARACRAILARQPAHDYALFLLGSIEGQLGHLDEAAKHLSLAVKANPRSPDALTGYAKVLLEQKRSADAVEMLTRALSLRPQNPMALVLRGQSFAALGKTEDALRDFTRALQLDPHSSALHHYAYLLLDAKRFAEAVAALDAALAVTPDNPELRYAHGYALQQIGRLDEALASYEKTLARDPKTVSAWLGGANVLMDRQRLEDALSWCDRGIAANPGDAPLRVLRGNILLHLGRHKESLASYDDAVGIDPDYAEAHYHRGSARLLGGQFKDGFADFEYRWRAADCGFDRPEIDAPEWRGEALAGKRILVFSEQGMGDTIQFARFLPLLAREGARVTFLCHPNLVRLMTSMGGDFDIIASMEAARRYDAQCALMSLPHRMGIGLSDIPVSVPYLHAEAARIAHWRAQIGDRGFKVGIAWQGNPIGQIDKGRSIPLACFAPLSQIPGVRLISLQRKHGLDQLVRLPQGMSVETLGDFDSGDDAFVDTAAIMRCLDLVVTSDTAVPHLAGALGVPAWVALKHVPDWRWMLDRGDNPWYSSLRLFRQAAPDGWNGVFAQIAQELAQKAAPRMSAS
jgi:tetratricopeptide (TPR) repeat protein